MANRGNGFSYAKGPYQVHWGIPASAFSAGNVLQYDSSSSLSAVNLTLANDFVGVAITDSDKSDSNGRVPFVTLLPNTVFWAHTATDVTSTYTEGSGWDFIASGGNHVIDSSATTVRVIIAPGGNQANIDQSDESRVQVYFLGSGTELEFV
jgi:hypothetical protein